MSSDASLGSQVTAIAPSRNVVLSPWVNESLPAWEELLSAHDVARLTRRPRWVLASLVLLGRFPRKCRYHGRGIGWLRSDVLDWIAKDLRIASCHPHSASLGRRSAGQICLPLGRAHEPQSDRARLGACINSADGHAFTRSSLR
jgi:predicted DNA-binding transcriptional regulator AlpA